MDILISNEQDEVLIDESFLFKAAKNALQYEHVDDDVELSIALVDEEEIRSLNSTYRGKDKPTDVLSFEVDSDDDLFDREISHHKEDIARTPRMLGDVIICPAIAVRQAEEYGQSFEQEMALLLTHGILHLLGYDHMDDSEADKMEAREREILSSLFEGKPSVDTRAVSEGEDE